MVLMRWCICPVVMEWQHPPDDWLLGNGNLKRGKPGGWWLRRPKVSFITDPGRPANPALDDNGQPILDGDGKPVMIPKVVTHSSAMSNGPPTPLFTVAPPPFVETDEDKWCLSLCAAVNFSELEKDVAIEDVLDEVYPDVEHPLFLNNTPQTRGWDVSHIDKVRGVMVDKGKVSEAEAETKVAQDTPFKNMLFEIGRRINPTFDASKMHTTIKE